MSDRHMRILRQLARHRQRELSGYDALEHATGIATTSHREDLARAATRTRAQVTHAQQRRSRPANAHRATPD